MKKPLTQYRVLFHRGHDDPGKPITHDSLWATKWQAELEASRHDLSEEQRAMGYHYSVVEIRRNESRKVFPRNRKQAGRRLFPKS